MIFDRFENFPRYRALSPRFDAAFGFLASADLRTLAGERIDIVAEEVWAFTLRKPARAAANAQLESHRRFADIQCCVAGEEQFGWAPDPGALRVAKPYDDEKDVEMLQGPPVDFLPLHSGWFAVVFPGEPHAPLIGAGTLAKVVLKVLINERSSDQKKLT